MSTLRQIWWVFRKDLRLSGRGRSRALSVLLFGVVTLLLFSFAVGPDSAALRASAAGFLLLALLLSSTLALNESFRLEHEDEALEGLVMLPVSGVALFYGKALANVLFLWILGPMLIPVALILYTLDPEPAMLLRLSGLWVLASMGLAAPGTLYAAMTSRSGHQDVALPLLLFPLVVPVLLGSVKAMDLVLSGDVMGQVGSWVLFLTGFAVVYWSVCGALFAPLIEDG